MRTSIRALGTGFALLGLTTVGQPAYAVDANERTAQLVAEVAPDQGLVEMLVADDESARTTVAGVNVEVSLDADEGLTLGEGNRSVAVPLPAEVNVEEGDVTADGTVVYQGDRGSADIAVQVLEEGAARVQTITANATEAHEFTYAFGDESSVQQSSDGSVYVLTAQDDGSVAVLEMAEPWARDAAGAVVPTHYELHGNDVVQVIESTETTTYPVVADPKFKWRALAYSAKFNKRETRDLANASGVVGACGALARSYPALAAPCVAAGAYLFAQANIAKGRGECVGLTIAPPGIVFRYRDSDCR